MVNPPTTIILWGFCTIFFASATSGLTGFGFALVTVPLLMILLPPKTVVPITLTLSSLGSILILFETRKWIDMRRIWPLIVAGVLGTPLGTYLLLILDVNTLKAMIGTVVALVALALFTGFRWRIQNERLVRVLAGFASGLLSGSTSMAGPPVILFFSNQGTEKQIFRANLTLYFTVLGLATLLSQWLGGLITEEVLVYSVRFLPALLVGILLGVKLAHKVSEAVFRRVTLVIMILTGLSAIASGVGLFW